MKALSQKWLLPLGFWLTDETYAVVIRRYPQTDNSPYKHWYHLGSAVFMYVNWNICTVIGMIAGQQLEGLADLGLDFALVVTFIAIVVPLVASRPMIVCVLVAAATSVLTYPVPNKLGLMIAALLGILAGMIAEAISNNRQTADPATLGQEAVP
jgi:predicted branched-subunit amino acid permease